METPKEPWSFCETPEEKCTMNYCDENGCQNRVRHLVKSDNTETLTNALQQIEKLEADKAELLEGGDGEEGNIYEVNFDGYVKAQFKIVGDKIEIIQAMNGYGNSIPLSEIIITNSK